MQALNDIEIDKIPLTKLAKDNSHYSNFLSFNYQLNSQIYFSKWFYSSNRGEKRVYEAFLEILLSLATEDIEVNSSESFLLPAYITHELISELSGVSRSYVTRIIEKLKEKKILSYVDNSIEILNINYFFKQLLF